MSKIIRAINAMIARSEKVSNVIARGSEYYFLYDEKYRWSLSYDEQDDVYHLCYYPGDEPLEQLAYGNFSREDSPPFVHYSSSDFGTREASESMLNLYTLLKEKVYGISDVLDKILEDEDLPF